MWVSGKWCKLSGSPSRMCQCWFGGAGAKMPKRILPGNCHLGRGCGHSRHYGGQNEWLNNTAGQALFLLCLERLTKAGCA